MGEMSFNLLHRLKFSIRTDVLLLVALIHLGTILRHGATGETNVDTTTTTTPEAAAHNKENVKFRRDIPAYVSPIDSSNYGNSLVYNNVIHRILRDEEQNIYRKENVRWRKINIGNDRLERRAKRDMANNEKIIDGDILATMTTKTATTTSTSILSQSANQSTVNSASTSLANQTASNAVEQQQPNNNKYNINNNNNSTKVLNFSNNKNLHEIVKSSDLDIKFNQSIINHSLSDILVLNFSHNSIKQIDTNVTNAFPNLIHLDVSHNQLQTFNLNLSGAHNNNKSKLILLDLSSNQLRSFDGRQLNNLKYLDLSCNSIVDATKLNLSELSDLAYVDLSGNSIKRLHRTLFQNLTKLKVVRLAGNRLNKIYKNYFFNLIDIEALLLSNNNISEIENDTFAYLPNLQYLDLSNNQLDATSIRALQGIPDLITLSVAFNPHMGNALQGFVASWSLKQLDASGTGLCQIPTALAQSVHTLNISNNHFQVSAFLISYIIILICEQFFFFNKILCFVA